MKSQELASSADTAATAAPAAAAAAAAAAAPGAAAAAAPAAASWFDVSQVQPLNFFDVLRQQLHLDPKSSGSMGCSTGVYIHLSGDVFYRKEAAFQQQQQQHRGMEVRFALQRSLSREETGEQAAAAAAAAAAPAAAAPGCLYTLEDLYVCEACSKVLSPLQVQDEVEFYTCPGCLDILPPSEAAACGLRCSKCFCCPRCSHGLSLCRKKRHLPLSSSAAAAAAVGGGESCLSQGVRCFVEDVDEDDGDLTAVAERFAAAAAAAERDAAEAGAAGCEALIEVEASSTAAAVAAAAAAGTEAVLSASKASAAASGALQASSSPCSRGDEEEGFAAAGALQRCDSLLSVLSLDGAGTGETDPAAAAGLAAAGSSTCCSRTHLYFYSCIQCSWNSDASGVKTPIPASLPLIATQDERESFSGFVFGEILHVLQRSAYEKERRRLLQQKVKNRAVAALIAAASRPNTRHGRRAAAAARQAAWRLSDVAAAEANRHKQVCDIDVWLFRRPQCWRFAAQRVSLAAVASGKHLTCRVEETLARAAAAAGAAAADEQATAEATDDTASSVTSVSSCSAAILRYPAFTEPLHAEQLQIDRGAPDVAPLCSTARVLASPKWLPVKERSGLLQTLYAAEASLAVAAGSRFLPLKRRQLLARRSRRCCDCGSYVVKAQVAPPHIGTTLKINKSAALFLPHLEVKPVGSLQAGQKGCAYVALSSYTDMPVVVKLLSATSSAAKRRTLRLQREERPGGSASSVQLTDDARRETLAQGTPRKQHPVENSTLSEDGEAAQPQDWWTVDWGGALAVELSCYDELLEEIEAARTEDASGLADRKGGGGGGDAVLLQCGNSCLLRLEINVHADTNDYPAVLPLAAEVTLQGGGSSPTFRVHYVAFLGTIGRQNWGEAYRRIETV